MFINFNIMKNTFPVVYNCKTKEDLLRQISEVNDVIVEFYKKVPLNIPQKDAIPDGWSLKKNMKHVINSNNFFSKFIGLPKFLIKIFGKPKNPQIPLEKISPTNRPNITDYGKYTGKENFSTGEKEKIIQNILKSSEKLKNSVQKRTEEELDGLSGLFGGMSLRTFVLFILKHNLHHVNVARLRLLNS